jgi:hypothetical protein
MEEPLDPEGAVEPDYEAVASRKLLADGIEPQKEGDDDGDDGECGFGSDAPTLTGRQVQGTDLGCIVNLGTRGTQAYRRCLRFDMTGERALLGGAEGAVGHAMHRGTAAP